MGVSSQLRLQQRGKISDIGRTSSVIRRDAPRVQRRRPQPRCRRRIALRGILASVARDRRPCGSGLAEGRISGHTYLLQLTYTPDAWAAMVNQPQNRVEAVRPVVEKLGGKLEHGWLAFGEYDAVVVVEMPENADAAAFAMAIAAGGAMKTIKTTPLLSVEEGIEAMRKAQGAGYRQGPADSGLVNRLLSEPGHRCDTHAAQIRRAERVTGCLRRPARAAAQSAFTQVTR